MYPSMPRDVALGGLPMTRTQINVSRPRGSRPGFVALLGSSAIIRARELTPRDAAYDVASLNPYRAFALVQEVTVRTGLDTRVRFYYGSVACIR